MKKNIWDHIEGMYKRTGFCLYLGKKDDDDMKMSGRIVIGKADEYNNNGEQVVDAVTKYIRRVFLDDEIRRNFYQENGIKRVNDVADKDTVKKYWVEAAISFMVTLDAVSKNKR